MALEWKEADASDIAMLQRFSCAIPRQVATSDGAVEAPRHWEIEVQKLIRRLHPPVPEGQYVQLGIESDSIQSVVAVFDDPAHPQFFHLQLVAIEVTQRANGGQLADATIEHLLQKIATIVRSSERSGSPILLTAKVHRQNFASQHCLRRAGFTIDVATEGEKYEQWVLRVDFAAENESESD